MPDVHERLKNAPLWDCPRGGLLCYIFNRLIGGSIYQYRLASEAVLYYWAATPSPLLTLAICHNYHPYLSIYCSFVFDLCSREEFASPYLMGLLYHTSGHLSRPFLIFFGRQGRNRTATLTIISRMLYHLSYLPISGFHSA